MKKVISVLLVCVMAFAMLAACGSKDDNATAFDDELGTANLIRVGISPDYPPYESYENDGTIVGFDVEVSNYIGKFLSEKYGKEYKIELVDMEFMSIISSLNAGTVDLGISCFSYDPERDVLFSDTYLTAGQGMMVAVDSGITSKEQLANTTIAAGEATTGAEEANKIAEELEGVKVILGDYDVLTEALRSGAISCIVSELPVIKNYEKNDSAFKVLDEVLTEEETKVIVKKGNDDLLNAVNEAIAAFLADENYDSLVTEYFG